MKTFLLKFVNWLLKRKDKNSHFIVMSRTQNETLIFIDGKVKEPRTVHGTLLSEDQQHKLDGYLDEYFELLPITFLIPPPINALSA